MNHTQTLKKRRGNNLTHSLRPILEANISLITKSDKKNYMRRKLLNQIKIIH